MALNAALLADNGTVELVTGVEYLRRDGWMEEEGGKRVQCGGNVSEYEGVERKKKKKRKCHIVICLRVLRLFRAIYEKKPWSNPYTGGL